MCRYRANLRMMYERTLVVLLQVQRGTGTCTGGGRLLQVQRGTVTGTGMQVLGNVRGILGEVPPYSTVHNTVHINVHLSVLQNAQWKRTGTC
jgi:hypothetical protein